MVYLNMNLFSLGRQNVRKYFNITILFQQRGNVLQSIHRDFFNEIKINYKYFAKICKKYTEILIIALSSIDLI